jgi:hypothetical protein
MRSSTEVALRVRWRLIQRRAWQLAVGRASWLLPNDCSDLALVLGDDSEAPAQIGQPAIIKGADLVGSNVEGGAPFNGEASETRPLGRDRFRSVRALPVWQSADSGKVLELV